MGDFQGHPFRGNQWTDGQVGVSVSRGDYLREGKDPYDAPHVDRGGGGRSPIGGLHVDDHLAAESKYYRGGQFLPEDTHTKTAKKAKAAAARESSRIPIGTPIAALEITKAGFSPGFWVSARVAGRSRLLGNKVWESKDEARLFAAEFLRHRAAMHEARGLAAHLTELVEKD